MNSRNAAEPSPWFHCRRPPVAPRIAAGGRKSTAAAGMAVLLAAILLAGRGGAADTRPRHVFLLIGDGFGEVQAEAAQRALAPEGKLAFQSFPVIGRQRTRSANADVTDSAAAATAIACGVRTLNGRIGLAPDGRPLDSIAVLAHRAGRRIGILTSVSLDHATPAAFYARSAARGDYPSIARQLADSPFEFFGGGGMAGQKAGDGSPDNLQRAISNGFFIARTREALACLPAGRRVLAFNHRLSSQAALPLALEARPDDVTLAEFAAAAIRRLQEEPFFIMVEGGMIDWACHDNDLGSMVREIAAFDEVVRRCLDFARGREDTLIVVTGDHETGGLRRLDDDVAGTPAVLLRQKMPRGALVARFGDLAARKADFAAVEPLLAEAFGAGIFADADRAGQETAWRACLQAADARKAAKEFSALVLRQVAAHAGYRFTSGGHTAADVPVYACGPGAGRFAGLYDNTEIFGRLHALMHGDE
jgi:alkaline phosphatase